MFCKTEKSAVLQSGRKNIGKRGIRTLGTLSSTHAFQAWTLNHSDIFPKNTLTGLSVFLAYYILRKKSIMEPRKTVLIPCQELLDSFSAIVKPYLDKILNYELSIMHCTSAGDKLLPKLMNL